MRSVFDGYRGLREDQGTREAGDSANRKLHGIHVALYALQRCYHIHDDFVQARVQVIFIQADTCKYYLSRSSNFSREI